MRPRVRSVLLYEGSTIAVATELSERSWEMGLGEYLGQGGGSSPRVSDAPVQTVLGMDYGRGLG